MDLMDRFFGPLGKEYCMYFYILTVFFGVMFFFSLLSLGMYILMNLRKMTIQFILNSAFGLVNGFLLYMVNRLMYSVCFKAL